MAYFSYCRAYHLKMKCFWHNRFYVTILMGTKFAPTNNTILMGTKFAPTNNTIQYLSFIMGSVCELCMYVFQHYYGLFKRSSSSQWRQVAVCL